MKIQISDILFDLYSSRYKFIRAIILTLFTMRYLCRFIICIMLMLFVVMPVSKLICYEYFTNISELRSNINRRVVYDGLKPEFKKYRFSWNWYVDGILTECCYKFRYDQFGFFCVSIKIKEVRKIDIVPEGDEVKTIENEIINSSLLDVTDMKRVHIQYTKEETRANMFSSSL